MNPLIDILQLACTILGLGLACHYLRNIFWIIADYNRSLTDEERRQVIGDDGVSVVVTTRGDFRQDNPPYSFWDKGESPTVWRERQHGWENNTTASSGCSRCECGNKYWENDTCIDCHTEHDPVLHDTFDMWATSLQSAYLFRTFIPALEGRKFTPYDFDAQGATPHRWMHNEFEVRLTNEGKSVVVLHFHMLDDPGPPDCAWNIVATPGTGETLNDVEVAVECVLDDDTSFHPLPVVQVDWTGRLEEDICSYIQAVFSMALRHDVMEEIWPTWDDDLGPSEDDWDKSAQSKSDYLYNVLIPALEGRELSLLSANRHDGFHPLQDDSYRVSLIHETGGTFVHLHVMSKLFGDEFRPDWSIVATPGYGDTDNDVPVEWRVDCDPGAECTALGQATVDWTGNVEDDIAAYTKAVLHVLVQHHVVFDTWPPDGDDGSGGDEGPGPTDYANSSADEDDDDDEPDPTKWPHIFDGSY